VSKIVSHIDISFFCSCVKKTAKYEIFTQTYCIIQNVYNRHVVRC